MAIQFAPSAVLAQIVKLIAPPLLPTLMDCAGGAGPPWAWVNVSDSGLADRPELTVRVTGMVVLLLEPGTVIVTCPKYGVTLAVNPEPLTLTVKVAGVVAELGLTVSQGEELPAEAAKFKAAPLVPTLMDCAGGAGPPWAWVKFTIAGDALSASVVTWATLLKGRSDSVAIRTT